MLAQTPTQTPTAGDGTAQRSNADAAREYLAFRLGAEEYAIDILRVQEIRGYEAPTRIIDAPPFVKGVVNLRGQIVPIVDLRLKFELGPPVYDGATVTIVLDIGDHVVGAVVDAVSDVVALSPADMRPVPELGAGVDSDYLVGLGVVPATDGKRLLILVDVSRLMASADIGLVDHAAH